MISTIDLFNLISSHYLNCYRTYLEILQDDSTIELRRTLLHRMHIYYKTLEVLYKDLLLKVWVNYDHYIVN